jgi:hypothetical protein
MNRRELLAVTGAAWLAPMAARAQVSDLNDAINKAGRQRMLSQRMAKSFLALGQGVEPDLAERTLNASMALFDRQLVELKVYAPNANIKSTYLELETAWDELKVLLVGEKPGKVKAEPVMAMSGKVLKLANDGTGQLEKVSSHPVGRLVNVSGRQRMLSQRMAAHYLSACWGVQVNACTTEMNKAREEFIVAHDLLKNAPEATTGIKGELGLAEQQWAFFDAALRSLKPGGNDKRAMSEVFTASERILQVMDRVTGMYSKLS